MSAGVSGLVGGSLFLAVAAAHALAVMSPGPDFAMVTRQTLAHGRASGILTAIGIASGISVHVAYAMFGLAWAIERLPVLLLLLRVAGALFLLWIGFGAIRTRSAVPASHSASGISADSEVLPRSPLSDFGIGFMTNVLNVKAMLFFIALCSTVIGGGVSAPMKLALGGWMIVATGVWFCFVAATLGHPSIREKLMRSAHWIDRAMGAILMLLGLGILLSQII